SEVYAVQNIRGSVVCRIVEARKSLMEALEQELLLGKRAKTAVDGNQHVVLGRGRSEIEIGIERIERDALDLEPRIDDRHERELPPEDAFLPRRIRTEL